uniref:Transmembrane protein n=1 Tax=Clandestinovirus TaxID=2831644 RepID=A0A8F8KSJ3_9VIRU|nr:transmembrane protein [Clandestinovirus]
MTDRQRYGPIYGLGGGSLVIGILGIVLGAINLHKTTCDQDILPLPVWLLVVGCVSLAGSTVTCCAVRAKAGRGRRVIVGWSLQGAFLLAWNIIGAVILFRGSMACQTEAYPMWAVTLVILCLQWASVGLVCFYYFLIAVFTCVKGCLHR